MKNENHELFSRFSLTVKILGCLRYFVITFNVGSLTLSETWIISYQLLGHYQLLGSNLGMAKVLTVFEKKSFKVFTISLSHCEKYRNFTQFHGVEILWKGIVSA